MNYANSLQAFILVANIIQRVPIKDILVTSITAEFCNMTEGEPTLVYSKYKNSLFVCMSFMFNIAELYFIKWLLRLEAQLYQITKTRK
jgi:hypothetical protein